MGTAIALIEPIQLPAVSSPARMPSLPGWLQQRSDALGSATQPDSKGQYRETPVLPPALILNSSQRAVVEEHVNGLARFLDLAEPVVLREQALTNDQAHGVMIAALLIKGGGQKLDKASSDALTEDYLDAIEDLPAWAVREALRKWNRGEAPALDGKKHDYNWRPTPPAVRKLAMLELWAIKSRIRKLEDVLSAQPLVEFSEEHRAAMLTQISDVLHDIGGKTVSRGTESSDAA